MTKTYAAHGAPDYDSKTALGCEADGEPVFLLRAQDIYAADTVRYWAGRVTNPEMKQQAEAKADSMEAWPEHKEPD
jgi:hypothetical protein